MGPQQTVLPGPLQLVIAISWLTVAVLACLSLIGVLGVNGFWVGLLVVGAPVTSLAVIVAAVQVGMTAFRGARTREPSPQSVSDLVQAT